MATEAIVAEQLRSGYGSLEVLHGIDLAVERCEVFAVLGRNGMGKSTLLRTLIGLLPVGSGRIRLFGKDVRRLPAHRRARMGIAYIPQEKALFQDLAVDENLRLGLDKPADYQRRLDRVGELFPVLPNRLSQRAGTLSGGEQKMLLVARAAMSSPELMLIDEISEGLQPSIRSALVQALRQERERRGITILLVEQNLDFALALADRYAVLKRGEIVAQGRTADSGARDLVESELAL